MFSYGMHIGIGWRLLMSLMKSTGSSDRSLHTGDGAEEVKCDDTSVTSDQS